MTCRRITSVGNFESSSSGLSIPCPVRLSWVQFGVPFRFPFWFAAPGPASCSGERMTNYVSTTWSKVSREVCELPAPCAVDGLFFFLIEIFFIAHSRFWPDTFLLFFSLSFRIVRNWMSAGSFLIDRSLSAWWVFQFSGKFLCLLFFL